MSHSTEVVAQVFAKAMADGIADKLVDEAGEPLSVNVPLAAGGSASLAFNDTSSHWILTVEQAVDHFSDEALDEHLEMLITETNMVRFSFGMVAGINGDGELSLSVPISGTPEARDVLVMLEGMVDLLAPKEGERREVSEIFADVNPMYWIRV